MSDNQVLVFDESCLQKWSSRKPRDDKKEQLSAQTAPIRAEQVLLNEIARVCLQKAADLRSVIHPDGLHIAMNDCLILATEQLIQATAQRFEQHHYGVWSFNPINAPVVNDWTNFRFTYRLPDDLYQEVAAAIVCWRRMSGVNLSFSLFINYAVVAFLQQEGFVFYGADEQPIADALTLYQTPEAELSKIELCLNGSLHPICRLPESSKNECGLPEQNGRQFAAVFYPDNRRLPESPESHETETSIAFRIPTIMSRLVNMCSCAAQLAHAEEMRQYDPQSGMQVSKTLEADAHAAYSFDDVIRQAMQMYLELQAYAQYTQQTLWGEPYAQVFNDDSLIAALPPQTTERPERKTEYHRFWLNVPQSLLDKWRQHPGSDNNKLMMALTVWLQLHGLYVCNASDNAAHRLASISLWQYCRMATGHEQYAIVMRDFDGRSDVQSYPAEVLFRLIASVQPGFYREEDEGWG
ncbi:MAG: hypothetical protein Q4B82_08555 [Alysiella sp.]|uniref:hypothetical protein n=1 Tax=Alysiella sp. TaxID=1872483 RepID=UPI0026DAE3D7|nr:hypothetical protein [Alysiella sp.]MDO4434612.1 hypothetical protein [Alysiella sp.]